MASGSLPDRSILRTNCIFSVSRTSTRPLRRGNAVPLSSGVKDHGVLVMRFADVGKPLSAGVYYEVYVLRAG